MSSVLFRDPFFGRNIQQYPATDVVKTVKELKLVDESGKKIWRGGTTLPIMK
jgi:hypothetical protein